MSSDRPCAGQGRIVWLTGLSGSGKTTLAHAIARALCSAGHACYVLDGDALRTGLNSDLGFSEADRHENIRRAGAVAALLADAGLICCCAFISPFAADRLVVRAGCAPDRFTEVHIATPLAACEARDPKGLYARARRGDLPGFTGIDSPYEAPSDPEVRLDTSSLSITTCVAAVLERLGFSDFLTLAGASAEEFARAVPAFRRAPP